MNFFEHQDAARKKTGTLVVLFVAAVVLIVVAVNIVVALIFGATGTAEGWDRIGHVNGVVTTRPAGPPLELYAIVSLITLAVIGGGSLYKIAALSGGGSAVAEMLGGRPLSPEPTDPDEIKLRNVVEEMSIASGMPVPGIYIMDNERGINAFAAGFSTHDAVVGVTRGCIEKLSRDELQGVIAHEFSHILNGDMRLNVRLIGILHGILVIGMIGYALLRSAAWSRPRYSRRDRNEGGAVIAMLALGVALLAIGYIGVFFGRLIQAAVSRQREYLADASAVQFTRNPSGIAGALKKIGGYSYGARVEASNAMEVSHMFFGSALGVGLNSLLATHPPLVDRIKAIEPGFDGRFPRVRVDVEKEAQGDMGTRRQGEGAPIPAHLSPAHLAASSSFSRTPPPLPRAVVYRPQQLVDDVGHPQSAHLLYAADLLRSLPPQVTRAAHDPFAAQVLVYCLLLSDRGPIRVRQMQHLRQQSDPAIHHEAQNLAPAVEALGPQARLPLLDLALPALRRLSMTQIEQFKQAVRNLIDADQEVSPFEFALYKILDRQVTPLNQPPRLPPTRYHALTPLMEEAGVLMSAIAFAGKDEPAARQAFAVGARQLGRADLAPAAADVAALDRSLDRLASAAPPIKRRLLESLAAAATADGQIQLLEAELLRAIAASLDCPVPPILHSAGSVQEAVGKE